MLKLTLCLFWVKITSENAFPYLPVFGCAWKMHFPKMVFSWPCVGCKLISVFILPSNTIFRKIEKERAEWEWDRGRRERERAHPSGQPSSGQRDRTQKEIEPRLCRRRSTSSFNFTLRLRRSTSPFDFAFAPIAIAVAAPIRRPRSRTQIRRPRSRSSLTPKPIVLLLFLLLSIWPEYDFFFFPGFYLCFWIEGWNYLFVWQVRKCEKMYFLCDFDFCCCRKIAFSTIQPNTRKYFSQYFLKCIQTLKNIFLFGK